jgi:anhydro-N-acetylmuramic acid kinase
MRNIKDKYIVLGLMSGTSMDGLDVSCAKYYKQNNTWCFDLLKAETFSYNESIKLDFLKAFNKKCNIEDIDIKFGDIISDYILLFLEKHHLVPDLISSHGHTIFHNPKNGYTTQVGSGKIISERIKMPVVSNFRQQDIDLGGQGAPLVPMGDKLLFSQYHACVNLGGIVNISYDDNGTRFAYDIGPCNMILNYISNKKGKAYDNNGEMALKGKVNPKLLNQLSNISYYNLSFPKSLGKEYIDSVFLPLINAHELKTVDILSTLVEHIAIQIGHVFQKHRIWNALFTGGGVFNDYLMSRINFHTPTKMIIPSNETINFKESIVFGFLGLLRYLNEDNCLSSATGASKNHSSGEIYLV